MFLKSLRIFFSKPRSLHYLLIAWVIPLIFCLFFQPALKTPGPLEITFEKSKIIEMEVETIDSAGIHRLKILPNPTLKSPFTIYRSQLSKIIIKSSDLEKPKVVVSEIWGKDPLVTDFEKNGASWESANLNRSAPPFGKAALWGRYLEWVIVLSAIFGMLWLGFRFQEFKSELAFFGLFLVPISYLGQLHWPGHLSFDALIDYKTALLETLAVSTGVFYSSLHIALIELYGSLSSGLILNLLLTAYFFTLVFSTTRKEWLSISLFCLGFCFFFGSKINQQLTIFQNRDITFSWIFLIFILQCAKPKSLWFSRIFPFVLAVMIRKDTLFLLPIFMLSEICRAKMDNHQNSYQSLRRFSVPIVVIILYLTGSPTFKEINMKPAYNVSAYLNPMMHIIAKYGKAVLTEEEIKSVADVVDFDEAIKVHLPLDIQEFHTQVVKIEALNSNDGESRLRKIATRLFVDYPKDFLTNRWEMGIGILGLTEKTYWFNNEAFHNPLFPELTQFLPTDNHSNGPDAWRNVSAARELVWYRVMLASCLPALIVMIGLLWFWRLFPMSSMASVMVLCRTLIVIGLAPANFYKYAWSTTIWGAFIPAIAAAEWQWRRKQKAEKVKTL